GLHLLDRALGRLGHGDQARDTTAAAAVAIPRAGRLGDGVRKHAADLKIGAGCRGGADPEEADVVRRGRRVSDFKEWKTEETRQDASARDLPPARRLIGSPHAV